MLRDGGRRANSAGWSDWGPIRPHAPALLSPAEDTVTSKNQLPWNLKDCQGGPHTATQPTLGGREAQRLLPPMSLFL